MSFVPNVTFGENIDGDGADETTDEFELESEDSTPVRAVFEVPHLSIKLCGELNKIEHDFVDIMFYDFRLKYEHTTPTVTSFDVSLGGILVEDLLQEPESPYRHLISSSAPRQHHLRERSLSAHQTSLSTSCPVVSDAGLNPKFSSSLPHCLSLSPRQSPYRSLAPLRPLMKKDKFPSMPSVNVSTDSDSSMEDLGQRRSATKHNKHNNLVHINVLLIDKQDEQFTSKYESVGTIIFGSFFSGYTSCLGCKMVKGYGFDYFTHDSKIAEIVHLQMTSKVTATHKGILPRTFVEVFSSCFLVKSSSWLQYPRIFVAVQVLFSSCWQVNRFVQVDFNSLETNLNLQTWVIVLEFFGIGVPQQPTASQPSSPSGTSAHSQQWNNSPLENHYAAEMEGANPYYHFL